VSGQNELEKDLQQRLSLLTPADTARGMFLNGIVEVVRELGNEAAVQQCLDVVGEKKFVDFFSYPSAKHVSMLYTAAALLSERYGGFDNALRAMGYQGTKNFLASTAGKLLLVLGQGNPKRLLNALPSAYAVSVSSLQAEVRWTGPNSAVFILRRDFIPLAYTEGSLKAVFETAKVRGFQVRSRQPEPLLGEYELSWQ
jgi:uncharacterized protein (TIGR02265 family)